MRNRLLFMHKELFGEQIAFDGQALLFLYRRLPQDITILKYQDERMDQEVEISVNFTTTFNRDSPQFIQFFNIQFKRVLLKSDLRAMGRDYFDPSQSIQIPKHKMELWPGFTTSVNHYQNGAMLNIDVSHKVLRTETVLEWMYNLHATLARGHVDFHTKCAEELIGCIVLTRYNNRTYRVDGIDWAKNPSSTFMSRNGKEISFNEFYATTHNRQLTDPQQPLLAVMRRRGRSDEDIIYLLPELCCMTGLEEAARKDFNVMRDMGSHTRVMPDRRFETINKFVTGLNEKTETRQELEKWNLKFDTVNKVNGKRLPPEIITFKATQANPGSMYEVQGSVDWGNDMRSVHMWTSVRLDRWIVVASPRDQTELNTFLQTLQRVVPPQGLEFAAPKIVSLKDDRPETYVQGIRSVFQESVQMVVCILPNDRKDRYDAIKKLCCTQLNVPTQCLQAKVIRNQKIMMNVVTNIAMQINCKLGGELWRVQIPLKNLMVIGIDVYHETVKKSNSCVGFCATINPHLTRYYSRAIFQSAGQELVHQLRPCMVAAIKKYKEMNNALPETIIVYRDGVGDGQLEIVLEEEVSQIRSAFGDLPDYKPRLAVILVKKRIHTRFFMPSNRGLTNPPAGACVDSGCVMSARPNFFLVPQSVRQGTVTPTHFNVLYDDTGLQPNHMQRLTFKLTHLYYNWPGTVRVPAPCQYAHKIAFLAGQNVQEMPSANLADRLYFL